MTITELLNKRATAWQAAKDFLDSHTDANGLMSAEDAQTYDRMEAEITSLSDQISRQQRARDMEDALRAPTSAPIFGNPAAPTDEKSGTASSAYNKAFWTALRNRHAGLDVRNALQIGTASEGGYLVPDEFEKELVDKLAADNVIRAHAHIIRTANGDHKIPVISTHGTANWLDEEANYSTVESDDAFTQVTLGAHKLGTLMKVSEELLNDSVFDLGAYIANEFGRRIAAAEEAAFLTGNGTGKPTGLTSSATAAATSASATAVTSEELIDVMYALAAPYRRNAVWVMNDSTIKLVRKLKDGLGQYMWQPALTAGQPDRLLGHEVLTSPSMPAATAGNVSVIFGDLNYYWIADREGRRVKRLDELFAATGQVGFLASERVDGKLVLAEAVVKLTQHA